MITIPCKIYSTGSLGAVKLIIKPNCDLTEHLFPFISYNTREQSQPILYRQISSFTQNYKHLLTHTSFTLNSKSDMATPIPASELHSGDETMNIPSSDYNFSGINPKFLDTPPQLFSSINFCNINSLRYTSQSAEHHLFY